MFPVSTAADGTLGTLGTVAPARLADDALIALSPDGAHLALGDATWVKRWVGTWMPRAPNAWVMVGCVGVASQSARRAVLRDVRAVLAGCGVAADRIRDTDELLAGPVAASGQGRFARVADVQGAAWLKAVPTDAFDDRTGHVHSHFATAADDRSSACTSES